LGAKAGDLYGLGDLLGLLLAVPVASSFKTLVDAWAARQGIPLASVEFSSESE